MTLSALPDGYSSAKLLQVGSRSEVYAALQLRDGSDVVLKVYKGTTAAQGAAAQREAEILRALAGPGIPAVLDLLLDPAPPMLVLQSAPGVTLASWAAQPPEAGPFLEVALRLADILERVHAARFMHCDVNPWNVIVDPATLETHLVDFGLARRFGSAERAGGLPSGGVGGALHYIAPEQTGRMNRGCDFRSDLYALGATLYHALTGRPPFEASDPLELIHASIARLPAAPSEVRAGISPVLSALLLKLLRKEPEERYPSARALHTDLCALRDEIVRSGTIRTDFELDAGAASAGLRFGARLYGRAREVARLRELYAGAAAGRPSVLWIDGEPGSGKSALVDALRPVLAETGGRLVSGKFDLYRERAYAGWSAALGSLAQQLLIESDASLASWRRALREGLGSIAQALVDLVPDLRFILGDVPPVPAVGPHETLVRLSLALRRLLGVCATPEHPLVIFLDDVQWSDAGSRVLLEDLLASEVPAGLLLIGGFRSAEPGAEHPLAALLHELEGQRRIDVESMALGALAPEAAVAMLADTLERSPRDARALAELVERKTHNNPLLMRQFLEHIHARGLLRHARGRGWHWDAAEIAAADIPDGAVELMTAKLGRLGPDARGLLEFASCVGEEFDVELLAELSGRERGSLEPAVYALTDAGLVAPCPRGLRFVHQRIREAVQALLGDAARARLHHDIARVLLARIPEAERETRAVAIVEHLNRGLAHLSPDMRLPAMQLNLAAGTRALARGASATCESYFSVARRLFGTEDWDTWHALGFELFLRSAESALLRGDFDAVRQLLDTLATRCTSPLEVAQVEVRRIRLLSLTVTPEECSRYALGVLRRFGWKWPLRPSRLRARLALRGVLWELRLRARRRRELLRPAKDRDPRLLAAMLVTGASSGVMTRFDVHLMSLVSCWIIRSNLRRGYVARPAYSLAGLATWMQIVVGDADAAKSVQRLALEWSEKVPEPALRPRAELTQHGILHSFWMRRRQALAPLDRTAESLRELGDLEYAYYTRFLKTYHGGLGGEPVAETERRLRELAEIVRGYGQHYPEPVGCHRIYRLLCEPQLRPADLDAAVGESAAWMRAQHGAAESYFRTLWLMVLCIFERFELGFAQSEALGERLWRSVPYVHVVDHAFYRGLAAAALATPLGRLRRRRYLRQLAASRRALRHWMQHGPDFQHMELILAAEQARLRRDFARARTLYERAAQRARQQEFVHHAALACERRARMLAQLRRDTEATEALREAALLYARWGAEGKAALLDRQRADLGGVGLRSER